MKHGLKTPYAYGSPREHPPTPEGDATSRGQGGGEARNSFRVPQHTTCHFRLKIKSVLPDRLGMPLPAAECRGTPSGGCRSFPFLLHFGFRLQSNSPFPVRTPYPDATNLRVERQCTTR
ncbi:hypothetical protein [Bacteroides xylanisolvens]|uniref:hypothetical protein n=2 Tax=Bacteroidales TaxID=171549 RepID=UPI0021669DAC|nr:hypothetical protein [Bacteroides xylanisolvens]MCS2626275.1 hypothetical protein [Bacteroides xylanisolvens]